MTPPEKVIVLRAETDGIDHRHLRARLHPDGTLTVEGHDLGPGTAPVSGDGEYEWVHTYEAAVVPDFLSALGGSTGEDPAVVLARYTGAKSHELERIARECGVPRPTWVHGG
jgi:hypothetical protein